MAEPDQTLVLNRAHFCKTDPGIVLCLGAVHNCFVLTLHIEIVKFHIFLNSTVILGGSAAKYLCEHLPTYDMDWSKWRIFFCDERHVSENDPESTYGFYNKHLFSRVSVSKDHIFEDNTNLLGSFFVKFMTLCDEFKEYDNLLLYSVFVNWQLWGVSEYLTVY